MRKDILTRNDKVDPADAEDSGETFLAGQIPVEDVDSPGALKERATEQQPNPAEAAKAVNPVDLADVDVPEDRKKGD